MFYLNVWFLDEITPLEQLYLAWTSLRILDTLRSRNYKGAEVQGEVLSSGAAIASHSAIALNNSKAVTITQFPKVHKFQAAETEKSKLVFVRSYCR